MSSQAGLLSCLSKGRPPGQEPGGVLCSCHIGTDAPSFEGYHGAGSAGGADEKEADAGHSGRGSDITFYEAREEAMSGMMEEAEAGGIRKG